MIVLIDNYDSFSYNLYQLLGQFDRRITVVRNDETTVGAIEAMGPDHLVISPGPGRPAEVGICEELFGILPARCPSWRVLGHQAICEAFGGEITYAERLMHGKQSVAHICNPSPLFRMCRRLSTLAAIIRWRRRGTLPDELEILAETDEKEIMAVGHRKYPIYGLQFHPESILTPEGPIMIRNFYSYRRRRFMRRGMSS